jgi:glyoxylase-like metal-dependent hydrolase (beta-lactamase superfamily II)
MLNWTTTAVPLEDELGDVLDKAMRRAGLTDESLAARTGVRAGRILDAIDYRSELTSDELRRIAAVLGLNEVGLCALGGGRYPLPEIGALPFCVWPLRMPHGIGVVNAYLVGECGGPNAVLFDTGAGLMALDAVWPRAIRAVDAVFLTHIEAEHAGGLCDVVARFGVKAAFLPRGATAPCGAAMGEGEKKNFGALEITAFTTPGHAAAHNCYVVRATPARRGGALLISGDLVFAGSAGGGYFSDEQQTANLRRVLGAVPPSTVVAPGHGPLTTAENELRYNPFVV